MPILKKHREFLKKIENINLECNFLPNNIKGYKELCDKVKGFSDKLYKVFSEEAKNRGYNSFDEKTSKESSPSTGFSASKITRAPGQDMKNLIDLEKKGRGIVARC